MLVNNKFMMISMKDKNIMQMTKVVIRMVHMKREKRALTSKIPTTTNMMLTKLNNEK